jgi:hypothetical protein
MLVAGLGYSTSHNTEVYGTTATDEVGNYDCYHFPLFQLKQFKRMETCQFILSLCVMEELNSSRNVDSRNIKPKFHSTWCHPRDWNLQNSSHSHLALDSGK